MRRVWRKEKVVLREKQEPTNYFRKVFDRWKEPSTEAQNLGEDAVQCESGSRDFAARGMEYLL